MKHGESRIRERLGLPKKAVGKRADRAVSEGTPRTEFSGSIRRYLDLLFHNSGGRADIRVHDGYVFIVRDGVVGTMWQLPPKYRNRKAALTARSKTEAPLT